MNHSSLGGDLPCPSDILIQHVVNPPQINLPCSQSIGTDVVAPLSWLLLLSGALGFLGPAFRDGVATQLTVLGADCHQGNLQSEFVIRSRV